MVSRLSSFLCALFLSFSLGWPTPLAAAEDDAPFQVAAQAAILGDLDTGEILLAQNADEIRSPASLTKVMTLYLIYEALAKGDLTLDTKLHVSEQAWRVGGSKTFVKVGDEVRLEELIQGIAVQSGNDACVVVAEHLGGTEQGFADLMNHKAQQLGMTNTHFLNSSGLPAEGHHTTARDLFILARHVMLDFPQYSHFSQLKEYTFNGIRQYNRNRLLWRDPSVTGLKTGHTAEAGYCMIATNEKDGQRLGAVILGSESSKLREAEALRMLRYGNRMYETVRLFNGGAEVRRLRVWKGESDEVPGVVDKPLMVTIPRKNRGDLEVGLLWKEPVMAPLARGDEVGSLVVKLKGTELLRRPVVAGVAVPEGGIFRRVVDGVRLQMGW
ncbi:MAG: D-alanyl-D-alanine carboxypeptidase [Magnetococcus sp. WYHC-3]